tara:strand:- start:3299 stop:3910 length:612 start_codon:yes stop_codon:yes gene_type:complete
MPKCVMAFPPPKSTLEKWVTGIRQKNPLADGDWRGPHGDAAARVRLEREPRLWLLPHEFVRDAIVLRTIELRDGEAIAKAIATYAPRLLNEHAAFLQDVHRRYATGAARRAPEQTSESISTFVTLATISKLRRLMPDARDNAIFEAAAKELGINRGVVRRVALRIDLEVKSLSPEDRAVFDETVRAAEEMIAEMQNAPKVGVR